MAAQLNEDLAQFKTIILSLISYATHPKLDTLIEKLTAKLTPPVVTSKRFLIKMEIKRLATPCSSVMDFRAFFDDCHPVKHKNVCHYLDKSSKTEFLKGVKNNNDIFSVLIYNELSEKAKKRHLAMMNNQEQDKAHSKIAISGVQKINLVNSHLFDEPQVQGKSKCRLFSYDPLGMSTRGKLKVGIEVSPLDINSSACLIKAPYQAIEDGDECVYLWFYQHDTSLDFKKEIVLKFIVTEHKKTQSGQFSHYLLCLSQASDHQMMIDFGELITKRLQVNNLSQSKHIKPLVASINAKCHEQYLLSNTVDIPMICAKYKTGWRPSISLKTPSNQALWQFFSDNSGHDPLARLFGNMAIQEAINTRGEFDDYAYILKHEYRINNANQAVAEHQPQQQFIIIWQSQLKDDITARTLLTKHVLNDNYRCVRLRILSVNAEQDAYVPSAMPSYVNPAMALLNRPLNKKTAHLLKASSKLAILSDVTELNKVLALNNALNVKHNYRCFETALNCPIAYILPNLKRKSSMEIVSVDNTDSRVEDRFEYDLSLTLTHSNRHKLNISGTTVNISCRGLLVKLDRKVRLKPGAHIRLKIDIPYRGKTITMPNQGYQLLSCQDDCILRLAINGQESKHTASQALREFIYKNMDELNYSGHQQESIYGLQRAMRNIYANNHLSVPFFIHQDKRQWHIGSVAMNQHTKIQHFDEKDISMQQMLLKMIEQENFRNYCLSLLNKINSKNPVEVFYILTLPRKLQQSEQYSFWFSDVSQLQKNGKLNDVLDKIKNVKKPTILRVQLSKANKMMDKYFRDELNYLEQISLPSADDLKSSLSLITGLGEITDHTEQVLQLIESFITKTELARVG